MTVTNTEGYSPLFHAPFIMQCCSLICQGRRRLDFGFNLFLEIWEVTFQCRNLHKLALQQIRRAAVMENTQEVPYLKNYARLRERSSQELELRWLVMWISKETRTTTIKNKDGSIIHNCCWPEIAPKPVTMCTGFVHTFGTNTYLQIVGSGIPGSAPLLKPEVKHTLHTYIKINKYVQISI